MRKFRTGINLSAVVSSQEVVQQQDPGLALRMYAAQEGVQAAAWLIWQCRKHFERTGEVDYRIPDDQETPAYVRVALAFIQLDHRHREKWSVVVFRRRHLGQTERVYRIRWADWAHYLGWRTDGCPTKNLERGSPTPPSGLPPTSGGDSPPES